MDIPRQALDARAAAKLKESEAEIKRLNRKVQRLEKRVAELKGRDDLAKSVIRDFSHLVGEYALDFDLPMERA